MIFTKEALYRMPLSLLFLIILSGQSAAQKKLTILKGIVQDSAQAKPLPFATVGLYRTTNQEKPIRNIFTDNKGRYEFSKVDTGHYVVYASNTGFSEKSSTAFIVTADSAIIELPPLLLITAPQDLAVVTVSARRPLIEQSDEKLIYNAESDPSNDGQTATDVLRKTPFVTVDGDGNVQVNGQSNFKVLLNGKETTMFARNLKETLQAFPANLIKKIEVITSPSAKYDGEGVGGLINIITKKKVMGYNGHLNVGRNFGLNRTMINGSLNYKVGKFGFSANYGINFLKDYVMQNESSVESLNPVAFYKRFSYGRRTNGNRYQFGNAELSFDIDSLNTVSVYANINGGKGTQYNKRSFGIISPDKSDTAMSLFMDTSHYNFPTFNWGTDYIRKFKKPEQELTLKMYHENSKDIPTMLNAQYHPGFTRFTQNNNYNINRQSTLQADYIHPLNKNQKIELGVKGIFRRATADYQSRVRYSLDSPFELDSSNSDKFSYDQHVYSGYVSYRFNIKKYSLRIGTRIEHTVITGDFETSKTDVKQNYTTWIPNILLTRKLNTIHTISLSYTKRLTRPYIWDLNPFVNNTDSLNLTYGNPNLNPEISHVGELAYTAIKGKTNINIKLTETFSNTLIVRYSSFDDKTGVTTWTSDNLGNSSSTSLSGNVTFSPHSKWRFTTNLGWRYDVIRNRLNSHQRNSGFGGWTSVSTNFDATKKISLFSNIDLWRSPAQMQGRNSNSFWYTIGGRYKFMKEKMTFAVHINNWFNKNNTWENIYADANFINRTAARGPARSMTISLRWNFGKLTENVSRKRGINNDDLRSNSNN